MVPAARAWRARKAPHDQLQGYKDQGSSVQVLPIRNDQWIRKEKWIFFAGVVILSVSHVLVEQGSNELDNGFRGDGKTASSTAGTSAGF
jgi:hypothetical protein